MFIFGEGGEVNTRPLLPAISSVWNCWRIPTANKQLPSTMVKWLSLLGCLVASLGCNGRNAGRHAGRILPVAAAQSPESHFLLHANPARINMGEVAQGGRKDATFTLTNSGTRTIELSRIDTTCPCLTVDVPLRIPPGEQVEGRVKLDLRKEPNFTGDVAIEIAGWTSTDEQAFFVVAAVHVPRKKGR